MEQFEKWKTNVNYAFEHLETNIAFVFYRVEGNFHQQASFSRLNLSLQPYTDLENLFRIGVKVKDLFQYSPKPEHSEQIKFISNCRQHPWPSWQEGTALSEQKVFLEICSKILAPLCEEEMVLEKRYHFSGRFHTGNIGIGTVKTWHGTPDARVRGASVILKKDNDDDDGGSSDGSATAEMEEVSVSYCSGSEESEGTTTLFEAKLCATASDLPQTVATCVTSAFTEKNLHPSLEPITPTIMIDKKSFRLCLYQCELDVLLISNRVPLATKDGLSRHAMTLLWLAINHR